MVPEDPFKQGLNHEEGENVMTKEENSESPDPALNTFS